MQYIHSTNPLFLQQNILLLEALNRLVAVGERRHVLLRVWQSSRWLLCNSSIGALAALQSSPQKTPYKERSFQFVILFIQEHE